MRHVAVSSGLQESEIRPSTLMSEFKRLSIEESKTYFLDPGEVEEIDCPACGSHLNSKVFEKYGFSYLLCADCKSIYVSPRPTDEALAHYYSESKASRYRVDHLARNTAQARHRHQIAANANWMGRIVDESTQSTSKSYTDIGTTLPQLFEEMASFDLFDALTTFEPVSPLDSVYSDLKVNVAESRPSEQTAVSSFEKLEHQFSPYDYLVSVKDMLSDEGIFFFTTRTVSGFDLQVLGGNAPYIFVPEHLNLMSIDGIEKLLDRAGLEILELSTPGQLDLQFVHHTVEQDPNIRIPAWISYLLTHRDAEAHEDFQAFLQKHRLSSHLRVAAKKKS
ncbi:MAG: methyltransferase domain-containing protein [Candidatus Omnitrophica bacterium]|nr:methyltransferase domain-containing protein [Candidatus Omnitrophota bacterium]MCA9444361.1 methyltransferase domain-containing protein [Candidatus Omnitrophota bacterium]MCB9767951.1 methyltransferase domain-containing protein [Candidatus Omnitrophota bacterium]